MSTATVVQTIKSEIQRLEAELEDLKRDAKDHQRPEEEWVLIVKLRSRHTRLNELRENLQALLR